MPQPADPGVAALKASYDAIWLRGRRAITEGRTVDDPLPEPGGMRWGISAVLRPTVVGEALARGAAEVAALQGPRGVVYGVSNLHLTLQQFEPFRDDVRADDPALVQRAAALAAFAPSVAPPILRLRGITASASGVLLQGWPEFDLPSWRVDLHRAMRAHGVPVTGPESREDALRTTAHMTLSLLGAAVERSDDLVDYVDRHRDTDFDTIAFPELRLVGYARTATSVTLIEYGRFPFGARAGSSR